MITELPTHEQCKVMVDHDTASPLEHFIYNYEPCANDEEWRRDLLNLLNEPQ